MPSVVVAFIDNALPGAKDQQRSGQPGYGLKSDYSGKLAALVKLVETLPDHLLLLESQAFAELLAATAAISDQLAKWQVNRSGALEPCGFGPLSPVTLIRKALDSCPDEAVPSTTADLPLVKDTELRESLRLDIAAAGSAIAHTNWKAATVLAGSVIEAILLDGIRQREDSEIEKAAKVVAQGGKWPRAPQARKVEEWTLEQYVEVAAGLGIIGDRTRTQCMQAKDFRNLIHPGRSKRLAMKCSRGTAYAAHAAVDFVIEDVS